MDCRKIYVVVGFSIFFLAGCFPPMYSTSSVKLQSPDGTINLEVTSRTWWGAWFWGPEPPKVTSCNGYIKGEIANGKSFKINSAKRYAGGACLETYCDIVWSLDSKFFALKTPFDVTIYNSEGTAINQYALNKKEKISTIHWRSDEIHGLYAVIKEDKHDLMPENSYFHPVKVRILYTSTEDNNWRTAFSKEYHDSWEFNTFVNNDLIGRNGGQEFQEISPDSRYFLYSNDRKIRLYDLIQGDEKVLFESPGSLDWIWWINNDCILFDFGKIGRQDQYVVYNIISEKNNNLSQAINALPREERYKKDWYKSMQCP